MSHGGRVWDHGVFFGSVLLHLPWLGSATTLLDIIGRHWRHPDLDRGMLAFALDLGQISSWSGEMRFWCWVRDGEGFVDWTPKVLDFSKASFRAL